MAKRELSSTLKSLKFMQRAAQREEQTKKEEEVIPDGNFVSPSNVNKKCVVIMDGDPHPGAIKGRMSFRSFNPFIDKLNGDAANPHQPEASATCSGNQGGRTFIRENGSSSDGTESLNEDRSNIDANGDLKRKQPEVVSDVPETQYPNKSPKNGQRNQQSSPHSSKSSFKQPKRDKLDWSVLRPPKSQNKRGENGSSSDGTESLNEDRSNIDANGDLKRKQPEVVSDVPETQYPNKSPKNGQRNQQSSPHSSKSSFKQPKRDKLDWSVLRPPKSQNKRGYASSMEDLSSQHD